MIVQVNTQNRAREYFLLSIWMFCVQCSAAVDGEPTWIMDPDGNTDDFTRSNGKKRHISEESDGFRNGISHSNTRKHPSSEDSGDFSYGHPNYERHSPFLQFYIDLGIIIIIMLALYLMWKIFAVLYPQMKFCGRKTRTNSSINQMTEIPPAGIDGVSICSPPDDSEVIIGFDNPLYESCLQAQSEDSIASKDKPPEYETVVLSERNNSTPCTVVKRNPESPPPKYFRNNPLFE